MTSYKLFLSPVTCHLSLFLVTCHLSPVFAVEVEPARLELTIPANESTQGNLTITNRAPKPVEVRFSTGPYRFFQPGIHLPSAKNWFSFEPASFTLASGASSTVSYSIAPPDNIAQDTAGEYLAAILVDEHPVTSPSLSQSKITIVPRFALPVYLKIRGRDIIQVEMTDVRVKSATSRKVGQKEGPLQEFLQIEITLKNAGTVHVRPTGTLAILHEKRGIVQASPLGKALPLLPTATLSVPATLPLPDSGRYRAIVTMEVEPGKMLQKEISFEVTPEREIR